MTTRTSATQRSARARLDSGGVPRSVLVVAGLAGAVLALPVISLAARAPWSRLGDLAGEPATVEALRLSLVVSAWATALALALGVPLAWTLARCRFPGRSLVRALAVLPLVLPPVVGGVALLATFGRRGLVGSWLEQTFGITLAFTTTGAVLAAAFVALPFVVVSVESGFAAADRRLEEAVATLGARRWRTFTAATLPALVPTLATGAILAWARALGEFGATLAFAGSFPGTTRTLPLEVYLRLETDPPAALALSLILVGVALVVLVALRGHWFGRRERIGGGHGR